MGDQEKPPFVIDLLQEILGEIYRFVPDTHPKFHGINSCGVPTKNQCTSRTSGKVACNRNKARDWL